MSAGRGSTDDITALDGILSVSRETGERLERFVGLLKKWQAADNLVAAGTLHLVWHRHVADSAQLFARFPEARRWLDLGSGAGFPGLVTAILLAGMPGAHVDLIESNARKCAFLRQVIRDTEAPATVHQDRIETLLAGWSAPVDRVSARGLARLDRLFSLAEPVLFGGAAGAFHKGQDFEREIEETAKSWKFDLVSYPSLTDSRGVILDIRRLRRMA